MGCILSTVVKYDITKHPNYPYTAGADKKNAFDMEKFLNHRLRLRENEEYIVGQSFTENP